MELEMMIVMYFDCVTYNSRESIFEEEEEIKIRAMEGAKKFKITI